MKFIHVGDAHLGAEPESGSRLGAVRREEIKESFFRVIEKCETEKIDLLLLPGDLFHGQPLLREVKEIDSLFRSLSHTKVVMCAGNHDCLLPNSHYYDVTFPENVTFLTDFTADSVYLPEINTEVFGLSYEKKQIEKSRYDDFCINDRSRINILLAHGNILCNDKSIPLHRDVLERAGFDYVALGHLHNPVEISHRIAYSGSLEPLNRGETGKKGYIFGEIKKEGTNPSELVREFVPHAKREYVEFKFTVSPETTEVTLCRELFAALTEQGLKNMYLVTLVGKRAQEVIWNKDSVITVLQNKGVNLIALSDETVPDFQTDRLKEEQKETLVGRFIERMEETEDRELRQLALQYGLQALLARDERK